LVLPGVVDSHVHVRDPGYTEKEDFASCSAAAAAGGVTTIMSQPNTDPVLDDADGFHATVAAARAGSVVDFALQALACERNLQDTPVLQELGVVCFEVFVGGVPESLATATREGQLAVFRAIAAAGGLVGLYPGDSDAVAALSQDGGVDPAAVLRANPSLLEAGALLPAAALAADAGCPIHVRQMSTEITCLSVAWLRDHVAGGRFTAEVTPHHLALTEDDFVRAGSAGYIMPPLRKAADVEALWRGVADGLVDTIGTDHSPHTEAEKDLGGADLQQAAGGFPGLETFLPVMLSEFLRRGLTVQDFVRLAAENPARLFRLYPRKGAIAVGSDADLAIVDDETRWQIDPGRFRSKAKYSPFAGREVRARADLTIVRGKTVWAGGEVVAEPGHGALLTAER
jgi:dihydroorotase